MTQVRVINVKRKGGAALPRCVYVGRQCRGWRAHPLANPFKVQDYAERWQCLHAYRKWLLARPTLEADLAELWEACEHGALPLGCWCSPLSCHGDVLAHELAKRFGGGEG